MTIDKAIEILIKVRKIADPDGKEGYWEALGLGIEALKFFKEFKLVVKRPEDAMLPGETLQ